MKTIELGDLSPKVKVKIGAETLEVSVPNVTKVKEYNATLKTIEDDEGKQFEALLDLLDELGFPKDKSNLLTPTQLNSLAQGLLDVAKKN